MELETVVTKLKRHNPVILGSEKFAKYAVMLPLIEKEDGIHVLFEVRSLELRRQPGEICFPGGKVDLEDKDERETAIRETMEELGISGENITEVYPLDFMVSPFGMLVYPYTGFISHSELIQPNPAEVGEIFTVPLSFFINKEPEIYHIEFKVVPEEKFPFDLIVGGQNYNWRTRGIEEYFYVYEGRTIWGMTARILAHFIEIIR
ncbi:NUDIX hydrolase [Neobacillus vireti]|uniref:NUDIX family hydrolase n=1 Tax=Neobacillus vireti LMG 21834 TaxID=1131730 RepID=A0AB94IMB1_9BACI|nr:CoA pyrophosphatase [Neobacillus vireti]ETI68160.1 NUDIX family hydrolase [Neobacillus vireti LMG 21834]KLT17379.1 NUDIX hydrolase [Neobacillus vireti]